MRFWYFIRGAPNKMWALYDKTKYEKGLTFSSGLVGWVERTKSGSWDCFYGNKYMGNEPNKKYAMKLIASDKK